MTSSGLPVLQITPIEITAFVELAFERMLTQAERLGELVNERPALDGANTVSQLVMHSVGLTRWWFDEVLLGRSVARDRQAEFATVASVEELRAAVGHLSEWLEQTLPDLVAAPEVVELPPLQSGGARSWPESKAGVVLHVIEELFQHAGHVDLTADLLLATPSQ